MENNKNMNAKGNKGNKRTEFVKGLAAVGIAASTTAGMVAMTVNSYNERKPMDMTNYNTDDKIYEYYIENSDDSEAIRLDKLNKMKLLERNISLYENLKNEKLTEAQNDNLNYAISSIKAEMRAGTVADIYLNDIFKEKIKDAYDVDKVTTEAYLTREAEEVINITLGKDYSEKLMDSKDKIDEIKTAIRDIVSLQELKEKSSYDENDVKEFIRAFENMKGFSNLKFVKKGDEPLSIEETVLVDLEDGKYTIYDVNIDDNKNVNITGKKDVVVKDNKIISDEEER